MSTLEHILLRRGNPFMIINWTLYNERKSHNNYLIPQQKTKYATDCIILKIKGGGHMNKNYAGH